LGWDRARVALSPVTSTVDSMSPSWVIQVSTRVEMAVTYHCVVEVVEGSRIASLATALAEPTRAAAVAALLSGAAHTSGELARACGVAPSTMSSHLGKLMDAGIVTVESAGRYVFLERRWVTVEDDVPRLTGDGELFVVDFGVDLDHLRTKRRPLLRLDLDWTERRHHLAGSLAAALMTHLFDEEWIRRRQDKRQLTVTEAGRTRFRETFGITVN